MLALVNANRFSDAIEVSLFGIVSACVEFSKGKFIRLVTVDLISTQVYEWGLRRGPTCCFKHVQGADRIDIEIVEWATGSQVMAGLSCRVDDQVRAGLAQAAQHRSSIADIELMMGEGFVCPAQALLVAAGIALRSEKIRPHIVVDAVYPPAPTAEMRDHF